MPAYAWVLEVRPGYEAEYRRRHDEIWPEMTEALGRAGFRNYSIFRHGLTLFGYFECDDLDSRVERLARSGIPFEHGPRNQPWMWREARLRDPSGNTIFLYRAGEARRFPPWRMGGPQEKTS